MNKISILYKLLYSRSVYTRDRNVIGENKGIYTSDDWNKTRAIDYKFYSNPSIQNYLEMINDDDSKIIAAKDLATKFDFTKINRIGDIGGIPFSQTWTLKKIFPHLKFHLTDYDSKSMKSFIDCLAFKSDDFTFEKFDAISDNLEIFNECDLLVMWGVDYALDDDALFRIFEYLLNNNKRILLSSMNIDNDYLFKNFLRLIYNFFQSFFGNARYHGVLRSQKYFQKLFKEKNIKSRLISSSNDYKIYLIN